MVKDKRRLKERLCLGVERRSDEALIGTANGVVKACTIRRLPKSQQWGVGLVNSLRGAPRRPAPGVSSDHIPTDTDDYFSAGVGEDDAVPAAPKPEEVKVNAQRRGEEEPRKCMFANLT